MLIGVPRAIRKAGRVTTLKHPNSIPCVVLRKRVSGAFGPFGTPPADEAGKLSSEDTADHDWDVMGEGRILFTGGFGGADMVERNDSLEQQSSVTAMIEFVQQPLPEEGQPTPPALECEKFDVVYVLIGQGVNLPYEIVDKTGSVNIPPYTYSFSLNARDDLDYLEDELDIPGT